MKLEAAILKANLITLPNVGIHINVDINYHRVRIIDIPVRVPAHILNEVPKYIGIYVFFVLLLCFLNLMRWFQFVSIFEI